MNEKKCRSLGIASIVCAGVSLVIFGALLDIVGFVLGMLAFRGAKGLLAANPTDPYAQNAFKLARIGVVLSFCFHCQYAHRRLPDASAHAGIDGRFWRNVLVAHKI